MQEVSKNDLDKAYQQFHIALTFDTNSSNVLGNIGVVYQRQGNNAMAIKYYQKALSKDPKNEVFERNLETLTKNK
jgi:Tfp pilus assembly protein PilF